MGTLSDDKFAFPANIEDDGRVTDHCTSCNSIHLCIIAPFTPLRVAPERTLYASFSFPDEFALEDFIEKISKLYPEKKDRPSLHLLIHSPGGDVSSSYVTAKVLRENFREIVGFIPHLAASGATILALSCDRLVLGPISRLTAIDPYFETEDGTVYPLSVVRAFDKLQLELATKTRGEISYPYQHLVQSISAEKYDQATHALHMVEKYVMDLLAKAGYDKEASSKIVRGVLYDVDLHEEIILAEQAKELGLRIENARDGKWSNCWNTARSWLRKYYLEPSPAHVIKYFSRETLTKDTQMNKKDAQFSRETLTKDTQMNTEDTQSISNPRERMET